MDALLRPAVPELLAPDRARFRQAFRRTAAGVWVLTAAHEGRRSGLTATSVVSLSAEPAELMVSVQPGSSSFPLLQAAGRFGVNLLAASQQAVAERFAGQDGSRGEERYRDAGWQRTPEGVWLLEGALAALACEVGEVLWRRTHAIVVGRIVRMMLGEEDAPLLYGDGRYTVAG